MLASSWSCKQLLLSGTLEGEGKHEITTPNIALFGFCWILKIRRLPVLGLEFEAESQKWMEARAGLRLGSWLAICGGHGTTPTNTISKLRSAKHCNGW